jgi:hypothetical protein
MKAFSRDRKTRKGMKRWQRAGLAEMGRWALAALLALAGATAAQAQEVGKTAKDYTYAPGSPGYWRNTHGGSPQGVSVFRRDPNIWVYTPELAKRVGMPLEWASEELRGVTAAAYRMERDGAEEDCGWGQNPKACKPVMRCVLELYFDRQTQVLPWAAGRMVADFYWQDISTAVHLLPAVGFEPAANGDRSRGSEKSPNYPSLGARQPFSDPKTGEELFFAAPNGEGGMRVLAYDREIHGRYAFVRLADGCGRAKHLYPNGERLQLQSRDKQFRTIKVFHEIFLPDAWIRRIRELDEENWQHDNEFYKKIWNNMNQGSKK